MSALLLALLTCLTDGSPPSGDVHAGEPFFLNARMGWVVLSDCDEDQDRTCRNTLWQTRDGGAHWSARSDAIVPDSESYGWTGVFIDASRAFLYGTGPLLFTSDGGRTFSVAASPAWVVRILPRGKTIWVLGATARSRVGNRVFVGHLENGGLRTHEVHAGEVESLVPLDDRQALILTSLRLSATEDGGAHWDEVPMPCPDQVRLVARDRKHLWLVCGNLEPPSSGPDRLFTSRDGGASWSASVEVPTPRTHVDYALARGDRIWATDCRSIPVGFDSGGKTYSFRLRDGTEFNASCFGLVQFIDPRHGWISYRGRLYSKRTLDAARANPLLDPEGEIGEWLFRTTDGGDTWDKALIAPY